MNNHLLLLKINPLVLGEDKKVLKKLIINKPRIRIEPIPGGLRVPHFHINDKVVLVDRIEFKEVIGEVAKELTGRPAEKAEYTETVGAICNLVPGAK